MRSTIQISGLEIPEEWLHIVQSPSQSLGIVKNFETCLAETWGSKWAVSTNSCTSGILASLLAIGIVRGDEVLVTPLSWPQTYFPALSLGAALTAADCSPVWPVLDSRALKKKINAKTKAVISVGLWGYTAGIKEVDFVCKQHGIPHILDGAQLHSLRTPQKSIGDLADMVVLSFGSTKEELPCGEGGAVLGSNNSLKDRLLYITAHPFRIHSELDDESLIEEGVEGFNYNLRIHPLAGLIGLKTLGKHEDGLYRERLEKKRRKIISLLGEYSIRILHPPRGWKHSMENRATILADARNLTCAERSKIELRLSRISAYSQGCCYKLINELKSLKRGTLFPWMKEMRFLSQKCS